MCWYWTQKEEAVDSFYVVTMFAGCYEKDKCYLFFSIFIFVILKQACGCQQRYSLLAAGVSHAGSEQQCVDGRLSDEQQERSVGQKHFPV